MSPFVARWLAETLRLQAASSGETIDDNEAVRQARAASADPEQRIVLRARYIGEREGLLPGLHEWQQRLRMTVLLAAVLAVVAGFSSALAVLGDGGRAVNIVWALGALLGLNIFMLLIWLGSLVMLRHDAGSGGLLGRLCLALARWINGRRNLLPARAFANLLARDGLERWLFSSLTHGLWLLMLIAAGAGLLLALSLRSYDFVWETTILSPDVFVSFIAVSGSVPAWFGFQLPDAEMVRQSASGLVTDQARVEGWGRIWASWLLGCLLVYGVLPRLLLFLACGIGLRRRLSALRLDIGSPQWLSLASRLSPRSERGGVTDPQPEAPIDGPLQRSPDSRGPAVLLTLELSSNEDWPPALSQDVVVLRDADSREQRQASLDAVQENRPARLLLSCDARLSPDRGSLHFLRDASAWSARSRVCLLHVGSAGEERLLSWQESLGAMGFAEHEIMRDRITALAWLEGNDHG